MELNTSKQGSLEELMVLAKGIGRVYTTADKNDYGCYYTDDLGSEETLLYGNTDPVARDAVEFFVMAMTMVLDGRLMEVMPMIE